MNKTIRDIKDELHDMFPQYKGFIEHTLVATMCNQYHLKQGQTLPIDSVSGWLDEDSNDCGCEPETCKMLKGSCKNLAYR